MPKVDLSVDLAGVKLKNPIVPVSGTFGFGEEYGQFFDITRLGAFCAKGLTLHPRNGNPPPRIAETPMGMLNSVGLQNPGVDAFLDFVWPKLKGLDVPVIANLSGNSPAEYAQMCEKLSAAGVAMLEINVSCPNVKAGGMAYGTDPKLVAEVTHQAKTHAGNTPVMVKLSPNVTDITVMAKAAEDAGADAVSLINTLLGMRIDINTHRPILHRNTGGFSGPAVLPVAVRMVWEVANAVNIPILGMGGVSTAEDAVEMLLAGATAVGMGSAIFRDPLAPIKAIEGLEAWCERHGIARAAELTGGAKPW